MWLIGAWIACSSGPAERPVGPRDEAVSELRETLDEIEALTDALRVDLDQGPVAPSDLALRIDPHPSVAELGYVRDPAPGTEQRLDAHAVRRIDGEVAHVPIDELEDYEPEDPTDASGAWVRELQQYAPGWIGATCNDVTMTRAARYAVRGEDGFAYSHLDLDALSDQLHDIPTGPEGYVVLQDTETGQYLVHHADSECVYQACTARSALPQRLVPPDPVRPSADDEPVDPECVPPGSTARLSVTQTPIPGTTWVLTVVDDPPINRNRHRHHTFLQLLACAAISLLLLAAYAVRRNLRSWGATEAPEDTVHETLVDAQGAPAPDTARPPDALRLFLNGFTVVGVALLAGILWTAHSHPHDPADAFEKVQDAHELEVFLDELAASELSAREELLLTVPTGVFVQSVTFQSSKEVLITGFVWQRYTYGVHDGVTRGFVMPESSDSSFEEVYRRDEGTGELIGWSFRVVLTQEFDYRRFPFGRENVWVQLWHAEFTENVVLVPDFASYKTTVPSRRPGLRWDLEIPGWVIQDTFFGYRYRTYDTSFGARSFKDLTHFPELHFNILVRPEIVQPLVSHILPIAVMVALLYAILLLSSRYRAKADAFGFNAMNAIAAGSGFFLVAVFSHAALRDELAFQGINYLEYFYFLTYVAIMVVVLNALLLSLSRVTWVHRYDNGLPKLLFWPAFLTIAILATLRVFW